MSELFHNQWNASSFKCFQFLTERQYFVDCTADGGSPEVVNLYAVFRNEVVNTSKQLDYSSAKASAQFDRPDRFAVKTLAAQARERV